MVDPSVEQGSNGPQIKRRQATALLRAHRHLLPVNSARGECRFYDMHLATKDSLSDGKWDAFGVSFSQRPRSKAGFPSERNNVRNPSEA
jgi:hypothetical protein